VELVPFPVIFVAKGVVSGTVLMNPIQQSAISALGERLGRSIGPLDENGDCVFVEIDGVTVTIGAKGAYGIPSVRRYDESLETAADACSLFSKQKRRDSRDLTKARGYTTGHLNPIVDALWRCSGDTDCPCRDEHDLDRRRHRSFRKK